MGCEVSATNSSWLRSLEALPELRYLAALRKVTKRREMFHCVPVSR
jgi:hypothetical protein